MDGGQVGQADRGVEPGWSLLEDEDGDVVIMSGDELRALQFLPDTDAGPDRPVFACFARRTTPMPIYDPDDEGYDSPWGRMRNVIGYKDVAEGEFDLAGYVTGFDYGTTWLNGGNPMGMLVPMGQYDADKFAEAEFEL